MSITGDDRSGSPAQGAHASFVLRCWIADEGQVRARLINVRSGISHAVAELSELPGLIGRLVQEGMPPQGEDVRDPNAE